MKTISVTEFKKMKAPEIKDSGCLTLTSDGEEIAIVIIGAKEEMRNKIIVCASQIDVSRGK